MNGGLQQEPTVLVAEPEPHQSGLAPWVMPEVLERPRTVRVSSTARLPVEALAAAGGGGGEE